MFESPVSYCGERVLFRDYIKRQDVLAILLEMCEEIGGHAREARKAGRKVELSVAYSEEICGGGFSRSRSLPEATNEPIEIYRLCMELFDQFYDGRPVHCLSICLTRLEAKYAVQLSLFDEHITRNQGLEKVIDSLHDPYASLNQGFTGHTRLYYKLKKA